MDMKHSKRNEEFSSQFTIIHLTRSDQNARISSRAGNDDDATDDSEHPAEPAIIVCINVIDQNQRLC